MSVLNGGLSDISGEEALVADPAVAHSGSQDGFLENFHLGIGVVGKVEGSRLDDGGLFG